MRVVGVGDLVTDYYYKNNQLLGACGGMSVHNIIANLAVMGHETMVFGACGNDSAGKIAVNSLASLSVDTTNIIRHDINTRCFHVSYFGDDGKLMFTSKKRCPLCNTKKWYDDSLISPNAVKTKIQQNDILLFDNLNKINLQIINIFDNIKMLDLGQYFELENFNDQQIRKIFQKQFCIINLNERVEKYLLKRFGLSSLQDVFKLLQSKLLIVTRGSRGADFIFNDTIIHKKLKDSATEIDSTGAGDAFFSVYISEYIKNNGTVNKEYIDKAFTNATNLTKRVVKCMGARGHIQKLYKIKKISNNCICEEFEVLERKQIKRSNININNLKVRVLNALNSTALKDISGIDFKNTNTALFVGTGGSFAAANFASKIINQMYGTNTQAMLPRDVLYRNNTNVDKIFLFSYSGTTNDLLSGTNSIDVNKKYIITKGEVSKVLFKTQFLKDHILSYRTDNNKTSERGFLSFEGAVAPAALFLSLYFKSQKIKTTIKFVEESIDYWNGYFNNYFKENRNFLKSILKNHEFINIFYGDFTSSGALDLESKIIESGIFNVLMHEKKNFSHGRFINYEHVSSKTNIYFEQNTPSKYEGKLLKYLKNDSNIILKSKYDGIKCEFDLLVASQFLIYYIGNLLDKDVSKPTYSDKALDVYFYKGDL